MTIRHGWIGVRGRHCGSIFLDCSLLGTAMWFHLVLEVGSSNGRKRSKPRSRKPAAEVFRGQERDRAMEDWPDREAGITGSPWFPNLQVLFIIQAVSNLGQVPIQPQRQCMSLKLTEHRSVGIGNYSGRRYLYYVIQVLWARLAQLTYS